jgi:predicted aldo/keto reductase-like oxidoreductase
MRPGRALPVLETGNIDLFMCTVNYVERHIYKFEEQVLPQARRRNIGVIGMKVLGGPARGASARLHATDDYRSALRYAWSVPGLAVAIIGVRTPEELRQGLAEARAFRPYSGAEMSSLLETSRAVAAQWGPLRGPVA